MNTRREDADIDFALTRTSEAFDILLRLVGCLEPMVPNLAFGL